MNNAERINEIKKNRLLSKDINGFQFFPLAIEENELKAREEAQKEIDQLKEQVSEGIRVAKRSMEYNKELREENTRIKEKIKSVLNLLDTLSENVDSAVFEKGASAIYLTIATIKNELRKEIN